MVHLMPINASAIATIVGIDPGTENLGMCSLSFDVQTLEVIGMNAQTFVGSKLGMNPWLVEMHSERFARIEAHKQNLIRVLQVHDPMIVVCESPFYNARRPNAGFALTEVIFALRCACIEYSSNLEFTLLDPPSVKKAVGAKGNAKKEEVLEAILKLPDSCYVGPGKITDLDEHALDSFAVAYSKLVEWRRYLHTT